MWRKKIFSLVFFILIVVLKIFSQTIEIPVIQNVTVDRLTQQALIQWSVSLPADVDGYIVKRQIFNQPGVVNGTFNTVATINDRNQMTYLDNGTDYGTSNPDLRSETYRVASFKVVGPNIEYSNMSEPVSTIFLSPVNFDLCHEQNSLIWTSYKAFGQDLGGYRVYYSATQTGTPILVDELPASDTSFIHAQVAANTQYFYFIEAFSIAAADSSLSNIQGITTVMPPVPLIMNADFGTIEMFNQITLSFTLDAVAEINAYKLLKSDAIGWPWDTIASYPSGTAQINTVDLIKTNQETVYYKVVAINSCGLESRQSNIAQNIVLESYPDPNPNAKYTNQLTWKPYQTWLGGVGSYKVYRSIDGEAFQEIADLDSSTLSYADDITDFVLPQRNGEQTKGYFCYYVEASEASGNPYGITGMSKSNISCAHQETVVFVPNAFNPNSTIDENRTFKPVISFANDYNLIIYNRWGDIVFQTKDPFEAWDGHSRSGELLPKATYVYYLKYRTRDNQLVEKSGQVNMVY
jgi:gliding motility-associated-like protein